MSESESGSGKNSVFAGALHYANLVALVGTAFIFLTVFMTGGTAQLVKMPRDPYNDLYGESVWDYIWNNVRAEDITVSRQPGFIVSFTFALVVALICAGISRKLIKEGHKPLLVVATIVLCGVGAGILHSYASILFVVPAVMAISLLVASLLGGLGGPAGAAVSGWSLRGSGGQPGAFAASGESTYPQTQAPAPAAPAASSSACPSCGTQNAKAEGSMFCGYCGAKF